jgi:hypothetical protein
MGTICLNNLRRWYLQENNTVHLEEAQEQYDDFVETALICRTDFAVARYSVTNNGLPRNNRFTSKVTQSRLIVCEKVYEISLRRSSVC